MSRIFISHSSRDNAIASQVRERLGRMGHTSVFLDFHPEDGIPAGSDWEKALYGVVLLFVNGLALDYVLEGPSVVRTLTIVTDKPDVVAGYLYQTMRVGVTEWQATGMYTDEDRHILFCTVSRAEAKRLVEAIQDADPEAFTVIGHAHQRRGGMVR